MDFKEIKLLIEAYMLEAPLQTTNRQFGVEFEMCFDINVLTKYVSDNPSAFPTPYDQNDFLRGNKVAWKKMLTREGFSDWDHHYDGSVNATKETDVACEIVTPILLGEDGLNQIKSFLQLAERLGGYTNYTCGGHVHIDAKDIITGTEKQVANRVILGLLTAKKFKPLLHALVPENRRGTYYASDVQVHPKKIGRTLSQVSDTVQSSKIHLMNLIDVFADDRYRSINFNSLQKHGTIEIRIFDGTVNYKTVEERVKFGISFVNLLAETEVDLSGHIKDLKSSLAELTQKGPRTEITKSILRDLVKLNIQTQKATIDYINYNSHQSNAIDLNNKIYNQLVKAVIEYPLYKKAVNLLNHKIIIDFRTQQNIDKVKSLDLGYHIAKNIKYDGTKVSFSPVAHDEKYEITIENLIIHDNNGELANAGYSPEEFLSKLDQPEAAPYVVAYDLYNKEKDSEVY